jgi:3-oxoacyl-[acyl-carrier-protein] synthase-3
MANQMIRSGQTRYALVIGAEVLTRYVDFTDRATCILFGDGAGAAVMGPAEGDRGVLSTRIYSDGRFAEQLYSPGGGTRIKPTAETLSQGLHYFKMKGNELFKIAVRSMADVSVEVLNEAGYKADDVKLFIPHQANQRITDAVASRLNVDGSVVYSNIAYHGNTSAASVPIALDECVEKGMMSEGDLVLLASFGGGVTWGGALIKW